MAEFVHVHGLYFPMDALALAIDLENRGFEMVRDGDVLRFTGQSESLSASDRSAIRKYKQHLLAICDICTQA